MERIGVAWGTRLGLCTASAFCFLFLLDSCLSLPEGTPLSPVP